MPKIFDFDVENHVRGIKRIDEDIWFSLHQRLLLEIVNTDYGRDLLCIDKKFPKICEISKKHIKVEIDRNEEEVKYFRV